MVPDAVGLGNGGPRGRSSAPSRNISKPETRMAPATARPSPADQPPSTRPAGPAARGSSRSQERLRFGEYSSAIASVLRITRPKPAWRWHAVATSGGWDWILYEYLWRWKPSMAEKLLIRILHGPLRLGLYARLLQSPLLRRRYLRWPTG